MVPGCAAQDGEIEGSTDVGLNRRRVSRKCLEMFGCLGGGEAGGSTSTFTVLRSMDECVAVFALEGELSSFGGLVA